MPIDEQHQLDAIDLRLLDLLQHDASLSNQALAGRAGISPPTCLRRVRRLREAGYIEREVALLSPDRLAPVLGHGLTAIVDIHLDRQDESAQRAFADRVAGDRAVQQCWRTSPGPDFTLVLHCRDMPDYLALAERLFTQDANVRNVRTRFALARLKFEPKLPLDPMNSGQKATKN